ncbi:hypothetical protein CCP2SC5_40013 [Azospirillaceae bacterium]
MNCLHDKYALLEFKSPFRMIKICDGSKVGVVLRTRAQKEETHHDSVRDFVTPVLVSSGFARWRNNWFGWFKRSMSRRRKTPS